MYNYKSNDKHFSRLFAIIFPIISFFYRCVKKKIAAAFAAAAKLLLAEGLAVGALIHGRVCLVGAHQNTIQGAEVLGIAVVCAGLYGAFNTLVGIGVHVFSLLSFGSGLV